MLEEDGTDRRGKSYRFQAYYQAQEVALTRRSVVAEIQWRDPARKKAPSDQPKVAGYFHGSTRIPGTEFPETLGTHPWGCTEVAGIDKAPTAATRVIVVVQL